MIHQDDDYTMMMRSKPPKLLIIKWLPSIMFLIKIVELKMFQFSINVLSAIMYRLSQFQSVCFILLSI